MSEEQRWTEPRYGKQMHVHDSALVGKERWYTTNAKKEEIFSDMSYKGGGGGGIWYGKIFARKNSATIVKSDGKNSATLFHGEGRGLRSALLTEGDTT